VAEKRVGGWNHALEQRVADGVAQLERMSRLKRFFSPALAKAIVGGGADDPLKSHRREIAVVFLDLRGFTAFTETSDPEAVMGVLREFHTAMGELILAHEGTLERFTGDGIMVFFNDPVPVADPAARAVRMALQMQQRTETHAEGWSWPRGGNGFATEPAGELPLKMLARPVQVVRVVGEKR
jgi:adenylate cyclase